jgi:hypothetical protein
MIEGRSNCALLLFQTKMCENKKRLGVWSKMPKRFALNAETFYFKS